MSADILGCAPVRSARESFDLHSTKLIRFYINDLRNESDRKAFAENLETRVYLGLSKFNKSTIADSIMAGEKLSAEQQRVFSKLAEKTTPFLSRRKVCG
jgi:hypothetical protein